VNGAIVIPSEVEGQREWCHCHPERRCAQRTEVEGPFQYRLQRNDLARL